MNLLGFNTVELIVLALSSFLVGLRRGGLQGGGIIAVALMVSQFGAAEAVGISVVIFICADLQAIFLFIKDLDAKLLLKFMIPTSFGLAAAALLGPYLPESLYKWILFSLLLITYGTQILHDRMDFKLDSATHQLLLTLVFGFLSGFTSMIGNLSSIFIAIFFATIRSTRDTFIATSIWFFFVVNMIKLPVHLFYWHSMEFNALYRILIFIPLITGGIFLGRFISRSLSEKSYWRFVTVMSGVGILRFAAGMAGLF